MSDRESREWDAWRDAHVIHVPCGRTLDKCECEDDE